MTPRVFAAVDIGASGGRVIAGLVDGDGVTLHDVHRFPNGPREIDGHLRWDIDGLFTEVLTGLGRVAHKFPQVESIGIDMWAVDYSLLDAHHRLLAPPISYRDPWTDAVIADVHRRVSPAELYARNGLQFLPFNTLYQLEAERHGPLWDDAASIVLLPDLLAYWLTGELASEATNVSTTGLVDVSTGRWSTALIEQLDLPADRLPPIQQPGQIRGVVQQELCTQLGLASSTVVTTVGSHDTASAVVALPATNRRFAYAASGTWSLVGLELDAPVVTPAARKANFTHERGVDARIRFLRNVGGLWLLQESLRAWGRNDLAALLDEAGALPRGGPLVDIDDPQFIPPGRMPERIAAAIETRGQRPPQTSAETVRCIIDSLATAYAATVRQATEVTGSDVDVIHIVGGGSQNGLLCQQTADATGLPVTAGPVEATALGNVLVQARAHGAAPQSLEDLRSMVARRADICRREPNPARTTR